MKMEIKVRKSIIEEPEKREVEVKLIPLETALYRDERYGNEDDPSVIRLDWVEEEHFDSDLLLKKEEVFENIAAMAAKELPGQYALALIDGQVLAGTTREVSHSRYWHVLLFNADRRSSIEQVEIVTPNSGKGALTTWWFDQIVGVSDIPSYI